MRKFIFFLSFFFLVLFVIATLIFAFLFFRSQSEIADKNNALSEALSKNEALKLQVEETDGNIEPTQLFEFEDTGADILVEYPQGWELTIDTDLSEDFANDPYARVLNGYDVNLQKGTAVLSFTRILGAVDGFGSGLKDSEYDIVEVSDSIVRFALKGTNQWTYSESIDCADLELFLEEAPTSYDICVGSFFPNFANIGATQASIDSSDKSILLEADTIVLSTQ